MLLRLLTKKVLSNQQGFTFIEVIIASAVVVIIAAVLSTALIYPLKEQVDSENAARAVFLAQQQAEKLKVTDWDQLVSMTRAESIPGYPGFKYIYEVESPDPYRKVITVKVFYPIHGKRQGTQILTFERTVNSK